VELQTVLQRNNGLFLLQDRAIADEHHADLSNELALQLTQWRTADNNSVGRFLNFSNILFCHIVFEHSKALINTFLIFWGRTNTWQRFA